MKKKSFLISTLMALTILSGCQNKEDDEESIVYNSDGTIQEPTELKGELSIALYLGGFGTTFLDKMIERFVEINPKVTVNEPEYFIGDTPAIDMIKSGPEDNDIDLFIAGPVFAGDLVEQGDTIIKKYDPILEDLTDVYESKPYNENITIKEKTYESVANSMYYSPDLNLFPQYEKYAGKIYSLPWAYGPGGLILNKSFFDENPSYSIPNTSDELVSLVDTIYKDYVEGKPDSQKVYPVIWAGENAASYWRYMTSVWIAQYDGLESWDRFLHTKDENGNFSNEVFNTPGMLKALEALAPIIKSSNCYPNSIGTRHVDAQVQLLRRKAAMLPSGDWTERETLQSESFGSQGADDIIMIRTPMISAVGEKLGISDADLSRIVTAVDEGKEALDGISQNVFDYVKEARFITSNCDFNHYMVIPSYSKSKQIAKAFIRFMFSDEGLRIFLKEAGGFMPYKLELTEEEEAQLSPFTQSTYRLGKTATMIAMDYTKSPIMYRNNLQLYNLPSGYVEHLLGKKDPQTAAEVMASCYEYVQNRWNTFKRIAGVK